MLRKSCIAVATVLISGCAAGSTPSRDPVRLAMRDAITAIQATTGAVGSLDATTGSIKTNTGNLLTSAQLSGLGLSLDATTGSIKTNTGNTATNTGTTAGNTGATATGITAPSTGTNAILTLLQTALNPAGFSATPFHQYDTLTHASADTALVQNQMVTALNKIVWNTFVTAENTRAIAAIGGTGVGSTNGTYYGTFASGGWITGGTPGRDSVPIVAMPDEFMVNRNATRALTEQFGSGVMDTINSGRLPSNVSAPSNVVQFRGGGTGGNAEMLARIDRLTAEVVQLRKENNAGNSAVVAGTNNIARATADGSATVADAVETGTKKHTAAIRMKSRDQRAG